MPSLTLLAADPHLIPVRARPALAFGGRRARAHRDHSRLGLRLPLRRRRGDQATVAGAPAHAAGPVEPGAAGQAGTPRRRRLWPAGRGAPSPSHRRALLGRRGIVAAVVVAVIASGLGVLRVWPPFAVVMSGSMAPTIKTGDMVVLKRLHSPAKVGEVVAVPVPDDARARYGYPPVVIHRVFRITDGQIRTKGDARPAADPFTVPQTAVDAKVVADIPAGGRLLSFFHSGPGLIWLLFGAVLFLGLPLLERLRDARAHEGEAIADLRDELAALSEELAQLRLEQERSQRTAEEALSQIDRLARLVADALDAQPPAAADAGTMPSGAEPGLAVPAEPARNFAPACAAVQTVRPLPEDRATAEAELVYENGAASQVQRGPAPLSAAATADPMPHDRPAPEPGRTPEAATNAMPADAPGLAPESTLAGHAARAGRSGARDAAAAVCGSVTEAAEISGADVATRTTARVPATAGFGPIAAWSWPAPERWDALPPCPSPDASGWAAPPVPVRPPRFQRPGRLIAASLAQPSSAA